MLTNYNYSLEERVTRALSALLLIEVAAEQGERDQDGHDVCEAIMVAAHDAHELLEPLKHAPAMIANWHPTLTPDEVPA